MTKINSIQSVSLDLVRLLAAQAVVIGHAIGFFDISSNMSYIQNTGVVIFFILSGLIISYTVMYKSQTHYSFKLFFIERFARIYSGLIPSLLFIAIADYLLQTYNSELYNYESAYNVRTFIGNIFMLQDYQNIGAYFAAMIPCEFYITSFGSGRPLWTLAIEWWLYMSFGLFYFYYKSFSWKYIPYLIIVSIVPLWNLIAGRGDGLTIYWLFGVIITFFVFQENSFPKKMAFVFTLLFAVFLIPALMIAKTAYSVKFAFFLAAFLFFMLLYQQKNYINYNGVFPKSIKFLAGYSFTLYLIHYTILDIIALLHLNFDKYVLAIFSFFIANIIALIIALFTEMKHKAFAKKLKIIVGV